MSSLISFILFEIIYFRIKNKAYKFTNNIKSIVCTMKKILIIEIELNKKIFIIFNFLLGMSILHTKYNIGRKIRIWNIIL